MNDSPDDQRSLELLGAYLEQLHAGQAPDRNAVLREHPELASALDCLDALENLAPEPGDSTLPSSGDPQGTDHPLGELPRAFGPYELLSEIGRGGMGVVYKARQESLDRVVAIKMILGGYLASPEHVRRFHAEAKAAAHVRHPNIVRIHEVGQLHGQDYFAMEYLEGQSLSTRIAHSPVDAETAVRLIAAVARAVDHLHSQGIIHRDLKPSNILLDADGQPYVTDFGLAKILAPGSDITTTRVVAGTPSYMAPEQATGAGGGAGPTADVYSLGAILYELLTGRPPFLEATRLDTLIEVLDREPAPPRQLNPRVPRELELICLKCLAKVPDDRYSSAAALADDLERFARGEALEVRPPNPGQRLWHWVRRQPALAVRLAGLTAFYIAFSIVVALKHHFQAAPVDWVYQWVMLYLVGVWAAVSIVCQQFLASRRWSIPARFVWGTVDSMLLLAVLLSGTGVVSPLVIGYGLLIVASGLWFRVRFVSFMTLLSLVSYGILVVDFYCWRPGLARDFRVDPERHVVNVIALLLVGVTVAYLVHRVRTLSSFYGRRLP